MVFAPEEAFCSVCSEIAWDSEETVKTVKVKHFLPLCTKQPITKGNISYSLKAQSDLLASKGLKERVVGNDNGVWTITERIEAEDTIGSEPTLIDGIDVRGDRTEFVDGINYVASRDQNATASFPDNVTLREASNQAFALNAAVKEQKGYVPVTADDIVKLRRTI